MNLPLRCVGYRPSTVTISIDKANLASVGDKLKVLLTIESVQIVELAETVVLHWRISFR
jgi:hypothetical protein